MSRIIFLFLTVVTVGLNGQATQIDVKLNHIGINEPNPTRFFHIEMPSLFDYNGLYTKVNYIGQTDVRAIEGYSVPMDGFGFGGYFTGGYQGLKAVGHGGASNFGNFPVYGVYAEATGTTGTRIGLFSSATGGTLNLAARFGAGDVEVQNRLRINTTNQVGRVHIVNSDNIGSTATAIQIDASNNGTESTFGTNVQASNNIGTGYVFGHYANVTAVGGGNAYAIYGRADNPNHYALFGWGKAYVRDDLNIGTTVDPYGGIYKLIVDGRIIAEEIRIQNSNAWPDYVFDDAYKLKSLSEVEDFINKNHHLPNIPSAADVDKEGIVLGEMQIKLMEKVEELTLYIIQQQKEIDQLKVELKQISDEK